ncbi:MAG: carbamoyltransferase [Acidobacteria bacterium]|nr:carbamoyltransferase [Acidobacteriota bacterium]
MRSLVLGLNAYHGDSAAALLADGAFTCGVEEERLNRVKHWAGFPAASIAHVLADSGATLADVAHVGISRDPSAHLLSKVLFTLKKRPGLDAITSRLSNHKKVAGLEERLAALAGGIPLGLKVHNVEHHRAHLASTFFCSPFEESACLTVDGFGDFLSSMSAVGRGNKLEILDEVAFPHSLGVFYTAITQYLGFPKYGDEYKVMGLASYGKPTFLSSMRKIVRLEKDGQFSVDVDFFRHASEGVTMAWEEGEPVLGQVFSEKLAEELGPAREPNGPLGEREHDIAASMQAMYEEAFFHRLRWIQKKTGLRKICLAGGCALNSVANGRIFTNTDFQDVYIQSAAGDAGTSLGAGLYVWHQILGNPRGFVMEHSYWGPKYDDARIVSAVKRNLPGWDGAATLREGDIEVSRTASEDALCTDTAAAVAGGEIVGWYQGRSEWGPRALGNRSIVVDPRRAEMKDVLNARIKRREPFRPFAPSILEERVGEYFEESYPDPFMVKVYPVRMEKRAEIPAVTHVDGTGRLQTVSRTQNRRYHKLISAFAEETGVPVVLNTSFNENEPIVNTPEEALDCFLRTKMHRIVLGDVTVKRIEEA